jgi:hypothetical protein
METEGQEATKTKRRAMVSEERGWWLEKRRDAQAGEALFSLSGEQAGEGQGAAFPSAGRRLDSLVWRQVDGLERTYSLQASWLAGHTGDRDGEADACEPAGLIEHAWIWPIPLALSSLPLIVTKRSRSQHGMRLCPPARPTTY